MDEIFRAILSLGSLFAIYKILNDVLFSRTKRHRDDYEFTKKYIEDLYAEKTHNLVIEKGFRALTDSLYSINEIKTLLSFSTPTTAIQLRKNSKKFVTFSQSNNAYKWNDRWSNDCIRYILNKLFIVLYYLFAFLPIYSLILPALGSKSHIHVSMTGLIILGLFAVFFAIKHIELSDAINFMHMYETDRTSNH
jgi:hypothetical protein